MSSVAKKAVALLLSNGVQAICQIAILVVCSRFLVQHQYGSFRQFLSIYEITIPILGLGLSQAVFYFFAKYPNRSIVVSAAIKIILSVSIPFYALLSFFSEEIAVHVFSNVNVSSLFAYLGPFAISGLLVPILSAALIDAGQARIVSVLTVVYVVLMAASVSAVASLTGSVENIIICRTVFSFAFVFFLYRFCKARVFLNEAGEQERISLRAVVAYSVPLGAAGAVGMLSQQIDKIAVSKFFGPEVFAVYANGAMEIPFVSIFTGAIATAFISDLTRKVRAGDVVGALIDFKRVASVSAIVLLPTFVFFFVFAEVFVVALFGESYRGSATPFRIYLLLVPIRVVFFGPVLIAFGQTKVVLIRSAIELILVFLVVVLMAAYVGPSGVAMGLVAVTYFWSVGFNLIKLKACFGVPIFELVPVRRLLMKFGVASAFIPMLYMMRSIAPISGALEMLLVAVFCYVLFMALVVMVLFFAKDEDVRALSRFVIGGRK